MSESPGNKKGNFVAWRNLVPKDDESAIESRDKGVYSSGKAVNFLCIFFKGLICLLTQAAEIYRWILDIFMLIQAPKQMADI